MSLSTMLKSIKISPSTILSIYDKNKKRYVNLSEMTRENYYITYIILSYKLRQSFDLDEKFIKRISQSETKKEEIRKYLKKNKLKIDFMENKNDQKKYNKLYGFLYKTSGCSNTAFKEISKSKKIIFCLFNNYLESIENLIEETNSEKDSLFYYKKDAVFINEKEIEKKEKESKKTINKILKKDDNKFVNDDVDFVLTELKNFKDKTICWGALTA